MLTVPNHGRFFGKSSGVMLIQTAIDMKKQFTGTESTGANAGGPYRRHFFQARRVEFWNPLPVSHHYTTALTGGLPPDTHVL